MNAVFVLPTVLPRIAGEVLSGSDVFLVFDLEVAFLYPWAVSLDSGGWPMLVILLVFLVILKPDISICGAKAPWIGRT